MKRRLFRELLRKGFHLFSGVFILFGYSLLYVFTGPQISILSLTALLLALLEIEYVRIVHKPSMGIFEDLFRRHEKNHLSGSVFLVISCIICFSAFNYWVGLLALFMTVFGDLVSALAGKAWGKVKLYKQKTLTGVMAGLAMNLVIGYVLLPTFQSLFIPMAIVAVFVELFTSKMDDNLTVPLFSGFVGQIIVFYLSLDLPPEHFPISGFLT
jgi:phytol kinase